MKSLGSFLYKIRSRGKFTEQGDSLPDTETPEPPADGTDLTIHDLLELGKNERRRFIAKETATASQVLTVRELSRRLAAHENDKHPEAVTGSERKRAYVALYQTHLPQLDACDIVDYDHDESDYVWPGPELQAFHHFLYVVETLAKNAYQNTEDPQ